jgi:hypothetical protein
MTLFASKGRGRPRKLGVPRDPRTGRIASGHDRQRPEAITATAEEARIRQLLGVEAWIKASRNDNTMLEARKRVSNPLLGSALGRFLFSKEIDQAQYDAGIWFAEIYRDWSILRGLPSPNMKALDYGAIPGRSTSAELEEDRVKGIRGKWEKAMKAIFNAHGDNGLTTGPVYEILKRVLVEDIGPQNAYELGNLRVGLNAIAKTRM